jgi:hypothetical protein
MAKFKEVLDKEFADGKELSGIKNLFADYSDTDTITA